MNSPSLEALRKRSAEAKASSIAYAERARGMVRIMSSGSQRSLANRSLTRDASGALEALAKSRVDISFFKAPEIELRLDEPGLLNWWTARTGSGCEYRIDASLTLVEGSPEVSTVKEGLQQLVLPRDRC
ncbi:unnamed protein product, partial [Polarella glacialis]